MPETFPVPRTRKTKPKEEPRFALPETVIDKVMNGINAEVRKGGFEQLFRVTEIVLEGFFENSMENYRARGEGDPSVRKLAERKGLKISGVTLYNYLRTAEFMDRTGAGPSQFENLDPRHFREVLGLPPERAMALLREANAGNWSSERLGEVAAVDRVRTGLDESRYVHRELDRNLRELDKLSAEADGMVADLKRANAAPERIERVEALLGELRLEVQAVHDDFEAANKPAKPE